MINALSACALPPGPASPVILMVSGGSDSTALLVRAATGELDLADGRGPVRIALERLHVLHINHCLRGADSDGDEAFVRDLARDLGIPCTVRRVDVGALVAGGGNMEEQARLVRYEAAWDLAGQLAVRAGVARESARIAVAHTADDRAETFLMRAMTGAGAAGLTGMRRLRGIVVRPLLGETREGLRSYLDERGICWREDATNAEDEHLRSYVRNRVVPAMCERNPAFARTISASLDVLADEDALLERLAGERLDAMELPSRPGMCAIDTESLRTCEPALARRALRRALAALYGEEGWEQARLEARHVEALLALARSGAGSVSLPLGVDARIDRDALVMRLPVGVGVNGHERSQGNDVLDDVDLPVPGEVAWGGRILRTRLVTVPEGVPMPGWARGYAGARCAELGLRVGATYALVEVPGPLSVGSPRVGERLRPFGMTGSKLLSDLLRDANVPVRDRCRVPVVRMRGEDGVQVCVWVGGIRLDARAAYGPASTELVELTLLNG